MATIQTSRNQSVSKTILAVLICFLSCSKGGSSGGGGNGGGGGGNSSTPEITKVPDNYPFWGDTITINGKNFGTNAADVSITYLPNSNNGGPFTSASGSVKIISVSSDQLKITAPLGATPGGNPIGPDWARIIVTVKGKSDTSEAMKMVGFPLIGSMCYHYGGISHASTYRPGDSTILEGGVQGLYATESGYLDKCKLIVNGLQVETKRRSSGATCSGMAFLLEPSTWAETNNCTVIPGTIGEPSRKMTFTIKVDGTSKSASREMFVLNQPTIVINSVAGEGNISISASNNPVLQITGKYMHFTQIKWISTLPTFTTSSPNQGLTPSLNVPIPLSLMQVGYTYVAYGITPCGNEVKLGTVTITQ